MVTVHGSPGGGGSCLLSSKILRQQHGAEYFLGNEFLTLMKIILKFVKPNIL